MQSPDSPTTTKGSEPAPPSPSRTRAFVVAWMTLFLAVTGLAMVSPLLPVFAEDMGASGIWLGLVFSAFAVTQLPLMPLVGRLSDRLGKKLFLWAGLLLYPAVAVGFIWSSNYQQLVIFRMGMGVGAAMVFPVASAYIGELAPPGREGRYMGLFSVAAIAGMGVGPLLGGAVHDAFSMDAAFASMGILCSLGAALVYFLLPREEPSHQALHSPSAGGPDVRAGSMSVMFRNRNVRGVVAFQVVWGLLLGGTVGTFVGVWMKEDLGTSVAAVGVVLAARSLVSGSLSYPFGRAADRMNRVNLATIGMLVVAAGTFSVPWLDSLTWLVIIFVVVGVFESMALPSANAIAVEAGRDSGMGSVMALSNMGNGVGMMIGGLMGGAIKDLAGIEWVFRFGALCAVAGILGFRMLWRNNLTSSGA